MFIPAGGFPRTLGKPTLLLNGNNKCVSIENHPFQYVVKKDYILWWLENFASCIFFHPVVESLEFRGDLFFLVDNQFFVFLSFRLFVFLSFRLFVLSPFCLFFYFLSIQFYVFFLLFFPFTLLLKVWNSERIPSFPLKSELSLFRAFGEKCNQILCS